MRPLEQAKLVRVFIGERDKIGHKPLYEVIVEKARTNGIAGATVIRAVEGYGATSIIHKAKILELSVDLPFIVEIVDSQEKVQAFLPLLEELFEQAESGGLITIETVEIIKYSHGKK